MEEIEMAKAIHLKERSTCEKKQVGVVITNKAITVEYSMGYNGNYPGGANKCDKPLDSICGCIHAETNALLKLKTSDDEKIIFTSMFPCKACAKNITAAGGFIKLFYAQDYSEGSHHWEEREETEIILKIAGIKIIKL